MQTPGKFAHLTEMDPWHPAGIHNAFAPQAIKD